MALWRLPLKLSVCAGLLLADSVAGLAQANAQPDRELAAPSLSARCQPVPVPGRVLCEVEAEVAEGSLEWADAVVVETPAFARALRARVGPAEATTRTPSRIRLPLALVATDVGEGQVVIAVRAVACASAGRCVPFRIRAEARITVGTSTPKGGR